MPIGNEQTISAPHMHAACLDLLADQLQPGASALDVGSGSGCGAADPRVAQTCVHPAASASRATCSCCCTLRLAAGKPPCCIVHLPAAVIAITWTAQVPDSGHGPPGVTWRPSTGRREVARPGRAERQQYQGARASLSRRM